MLQGLYERNQGRLEKAVEDIVNQLSSTASNQKDWRATLGMFDGDSMMREIIDESLQAREEERRRFYEDHDRENGSS